MPESDYKRFMNFLAAHDCVIDFREFRCTPLEAAGFVSPSTVALPGETASPARARTAKAHLADVRGPAA